ncbi:RNA polymerase sigma-70 factor [uncultured Chitinophaga sp.]|uniref:RNA polymerase sigma-70 factor n=1 Tax=uncultured Chitinophaga sp. TaxID=339340 RepID=UPI0025E84E40|nr:RNA polymerase sigma-70 factor [uncultured Chitinophaga sp.]
MGITLPELPDDLLLDECRKGNTKAFDVLFNRYSGKLYHYALKYTSDEARAEEAMMDLMLWVWEKREQLPADIQFASYLFRAMKNAVIKIVTRRQGRTIPLEHIEEQLTTGAYEAGSRVACNELNNAYQQQLDQLSSQRQKVFILSRHNNLSHAEIAKEMNLSPFTVKNHIKASLSHFRDHLKDYADISTLILLCCMLG